MPLSPSGVVPALSDGTRDDAEWIRGNAGSPYSLDVIACGCVTLSGPVSTTPSGLDGALAVLPALLLPILALGGLILTAVLLTRVLRGIRAPDLDLNPPGETTVV